ncbi:LysR family transcriptional regulator [Rhizobium puerariae]|uniref:LysR family transcriptional regulator n=1 Tax=Rhizobium puerariae TaxID=1585791 RepID=A0ABV6AEW8_9HYPH
MDTNDVRVFTIAVVAGSLAAAARRLGVTPMAASRSLTSLETGLGVRLLHRTTRSLSLTAEGETFLPFAQALVENEEEALARLRPDADGASGMLRMTTSVAFGLKFVAPLVPELLEKNPELRIVLDLSDAHPDLISSGMDLAIRIARLRDSSMIAQKLADSPRILVAAPDYVERHGLPASVDSLIDHQCLPLAGGTHWTFVAGGGEKHVRLASRFSSSSIEGCRSVCLAGGGIALLSAWNVTEDLAAGHLVRISLGDGTPEPLGIWAVYPTNKLLLPKVRVLVSALRASLAAHEAFQTRTERPPSMA